MRDTELMLRRFGFRRQQCYAPAKGLSGGERRRAYLVSVLLKKPNLLLLDEPTNDLDLATIACLEDYVENFEGMVVMTSHDRAFMQQCADTLLVLGGSGRGKRARVWEGSFNEYAAAAREEAAAAAAERAAGEGSISAAGSKAAGGRTAGGDGSDGHEAPVELTKAEKQAAYEAQKRVAQAGKRIKTIAAKLESLEEAQLEVAAEMEACGADAGALAEITPRAEELQAKVDALYLEWEELEELA